jgi:hypothetical protein
MKRQLTTHPNSPGELDFQVLVGLSFGVSQTLFQEKDCEPGHATTRDPACGPLGRGGDRLIRHFLLFHETVKLLETGARSFREVAACLDDRSIAPSDPSVPTTASSLRRMKKAVETHFHGQGFGPLFRLQKRGLPYRVTDEGRRAVQQVRDFLAAHHMLATND